VLINVGHGQNGLLSAALLGAGLVQLDRRPLLAGILFGCLAYKPQFGLMIPLVLGASGRWRAFGGAAVAVALLTTATIAIFGAHVWQAFIDSTRFTRFVALEQGDVGWYKIQSIFAWARMWSASVPMAYALQGVLDLALAASLILLWRSATTPYPLKAAGLCLGTILATPFALDYDMMMLAPAIAFIAADGLARGFGPWQKTALAALWLAPLIARPIAHMTLVPLGVPAMLVMFVLLLRRNTLHLDLPITSSGAFLLK
jgi:alpha-1,2-mannosyltransferase